MLLTRRRLADRGRWLSEGSKVCCRRVLDLRVEFSGNLPERGLLVANHLSYVDIIALSSILPCRFVAKSDVANWPIFGLMAKKSHTLFIDRELRRDVSRINELLRAALKDPVPLVLFPEGTSSDGSDVLAFRPSLLEPALKSRSPIVPVGISYLGEASRIVPWYGDMTLAPHLLNLLNHRGLAVRIDFGEPRVVNTDRKTAARQLRDEVVALRRGKTISSQPYPLDKPELA
ncbi:MAG TPA: lysophospholipid acyltransferase family protein [Chthoniobacterales bacterium]